MYCKECGTEVTSGEYCQNCGTKAESVTSKQKESTNTLIDNKAIQIIAVIVGIFIIIYALLQMIMAL